MFLNTVSIVRITQILIDNGWKFIDNGINSIEYVVKDEEKIHFKSNEEFEKWLFKEFDKSIW